MSNLKMITVSLTLAFTAALTVSDYSAFAQSAYYPSYTNSSEQYQQTLPSQQSIYPPYYTNSQAQYEQSAEGQPLTSTYPSVSNYPPSSWPSDYSSNTSTEWELRQREVKKWSSGLGAILSEALKLILK